MQGSGGLFQAAVDQLVSLGVTTAVLVDIAVELADSTIPTVPCGMPGRVRVLHQMEQRGQVAPLKNAYERTKADKTASAAKITDLERQLAEMAKGKPDEAATLAKLKSFEDQLAAEKTRADDLAGKLTGVTRDRALADALQGAGVTSPAFLRAAQAMLGGNVKIDGDTAIVETAMGPKLLGDFVKGWVAGEGKDFVIQKLRQVD